MKWISLILMLSSISPSFAATIAVIDSGLDYKHEMITPNLWTNANEVEDRRDNDGNGYQDDIHGWNFGEQNAMIIDYKYIGTFSPDCKKYFDIQGKKFLNLATEEEIAWMKAKVGDKKFLKEMGKFGNFVHGTHVAGISIQDSKNQAMGIKLIPTETKLWARNLSRSAVSDAKADKWQLLDTAFNALAEQQMKLLADIAKFAAFHKSDVANGSFGTGFKNAKIITDNAYRLVFFKKPTAEDSDKAAHMFLNALIKHGDTFVNAAPNMLFVFAAGNDGMSNDLYGSSPANIRAVNVITVGATYKNEFFAPFSNYGTKMVDIAAPGMLIHSAIPGTSEYLSVSGTSQASPFVANVAAKVKAANPKLKPLEIKTILMGTVDKKGFLSDKVTAGGIVNNERAVVAAQLSRTISVSEAIARAKKQITAEDSFVSDVNPKAVAPIELQPMFR